MGVAQNSVRVSRTIRADAERLLGDYLLTQVFSSDHREQIANGGLGKEIFAVVLRANTHSTRLLICGGETFFALCALDQSGAGSLLFRALSDRSSAHLETMLRSFQLKLCTTQRQRSTLTALLAHLCELYNDCL